MLVTHHPVRERRRLRGWQSGLTPPWSPGGGTASRRSAVSESTPPRIPNCLPMTVLSRQSDGRSSHHGLPSRADGGRRARRRGGLKATSKLTHYREPSVVRLRSRPPQGGVPPPGLEHGSYRHCAARRRRRCPAAALSGRTPNLGYEAASVPSDRRRPGGSRCGRAAACREGDDGDSGRILRDESATKAPSWNNVLRTDTWTTGVGGISAPPRQSVGGGLLSLRSCSAPLVLAGFRERDFS